MAIIDSRGFQLVPDTTQFAQGIGGMVSQRIAQRLAQQASGGDQQAMSELAVRDPRAAHSIGNILHDERQRKLQEQQRTQEMAYRVARGYRAASDKGAFLAAASQQLRGAGMEDIATEIDDDIATFATDPGRVNSEYDGIFNMFAPENERTAGQREFESLTAGLSKEDKEKARRIELGLDHRAVGSAAMTIANTGQTGVVAGSQAAIKGAEAAAQESSKLGVQGEMLPGVQAATTAATEAEKNKAAIAGDTGKSVNERQMSFIDSGVAAAEQLPDYDRMLTLLDNVRTGNASNLSQSALNLFGAASADYQELDSMMKKAIIANMKAFGANPTEGERKFLLESTGDIRQSSETIERMLKKYRGKAKLAVTRGRRLAEQRKDQDALDLMNGVDRKPAPQPQSSPAAQPSIDDLINKYGQ